MSHNALFRDPVITAGYDAKPQYPLTGPFLCYDTRDHDHGATGYATKNAGSPATVNSTGTLPNTGSAGSIADLAVAQQSLWSTGDVQLGDYARYQTSAGKQVSTGAPFAYFNSMTGGPPSNGPYVWISVTGNLLNPTLSFPNPPYNEWPPTNDHGCQFNWNVTFNGVWTVMLRHLIGFSETVTENDISFEADSFFPGVNSTSHLASDVRGRPLFNLLMPDHQDQWSNRMFVEMIDPVAGLCDAYGFGHWIADDDRLGFTSGVDYIGEEWWGMGDETSPIPERTYARNGDVMANGAQVDAAYVSTGTTSWYIGTDNMRQYDAGNGSAKPVAGVPWSIWRGWGLWRGSPTAADLAIIANDFGVASL